MSQNTEDFEEAKRSWTETEVKKHGQLWKEHIARAYEDRIDNIIAELSSVPSPGRARASGLERELAVLEKQQREGIPMLTGEEIFMLEWRDMLIEMGSFLHVEEKGLPRGVVDGGIVDVNLYFGERIGALLTAHDRVREEAPLEESFRTLLDREYDRLRLLEYDQSSRAAYDAQKRILFSHNHNQNEVKGEKMNQSTQDKLDAYVKRHHDIMMELDDNLDLSEEERRSLAQEYEKLGRTIVSLEEELRREEALEGEQYGRQTVSQATSDEQYRLTDEEIRLLDRRAELVAKLRDTDAELSDSQALIMEDDIAKLDQHFGERLEAAVTAHKRFRAETPKAASSNKDRFQRSQDAQAAFVARFAETMRNIAAQGGMSGDMAARSLPYSAVSGHEFSGANMALLMLKSEEMGYTDDRWLTFEQLQKVREEYPDENIHIRAGEKGTTVLTSRWVSYVEENGERRVLTPEETLDCEQRKNNGLDAPEVKKALLYTPYTVFNAQQIENFPARGKERPAMSSRERRELVDRFVAASGIDLDYTAQRSPSRFDENENRITMSGPHLFQRMGNFLLQKLRETFRAFGHESRENSPLYAGETLRKRGLEEMRAEVLGMLAGRYLGIERDTGRMAQHVGLWDRAFGEKDTRSLFRAVTDAGKVLTLLHQFAEGETPRAKWFPPKETWEENFRATEYKEVKAMLEFVGEELRMQRNDSPAPHPQLGESILRAVEREAPLDELRDKLKEAWPVLANAPHLVTVGLAESAAKYLPEGMFEREREKVAATMDGARRMQQQTREQGAAPEAPQEAPVPPVAAAQPEPPTKTEIREQALKAFDNMSDDTVTRVRMLLRDPDFLKAALKDDPECARDLASLCDNVSTALHAELEEMKQREHDTPAPQASSPAPRMR